ncbi:MAG: ABC transporter permease [Candidatus Cloacimonetes bacterium]|nr:ABC transporter permease [Candidatus Cloacimonadota bacterium]MCF7814886.1 ABC transporter permease [Candidatus Cloacimonadota bacterium]MCF7869209.1 ABC transporter permease [Candidatus Cloacimonadota bacterium]MCF7884642.1 ABC transporter permease [Candidatus Cloacimonadota bacterium]
MLKNYLQITFRNMARHKVITLINILGLVLGITAFMLIMIWVGFEFSYDKYHENKDRIVRLCVDLEAGSHMIYPMSMPLAAPNLIEDFPEVVDAARLENPTRVSLKIGEETYQEAGFCHGDNSIFNVFSFPFVQGDSNSALKDPFTVVISQNIAENYFAESNPIGETLMINGIGPYTITGIFQNIPQNSHFKFQLMASFSTLFDQQKEMMENWFHIQFYTYLLLDKNVNWQQFEAKLPTFVNKYMGQMLDSFGAKLIFFMQPLTDIHLFSDLAGDIAPQADIKYLYLFIAIALFVLVIACINFINLATANASIRAKEIGMRKTIGSNRKQIVMQFLLESVILCFIAVLLSVSVLEMIRPYFGDIFGTYIDLSYLNLWQMTGIIMLFPIVVGILAGSYPAFYLSGLKPVNVLKSGIYKSKNRSSLRSVLVVFQFAISIILTISTLTIFSQINFMKYSDPGFKKNSMIVIPGVRQIIKQTSLEVLKNELSEISEIDGIGFSSLFPGRGTQKAIMFPEGFAEDDPQMGEKLFVDADFISTMNIDVVEGRNFSEELATDPQQSVLINQTAVQKFGWKKTVGKTFNMKSRDGGSYKMNVVGVVKDFHSSSLHNPIQPLIIYYNTDRVNYLVIKINSKNFEKTIQLIKKKIKQINPDHVLKYYFLDETLNTMYRRDQQTGKLALYFSSLSIILGCLGLLGLTSFLVQNRTKEIGIRKVLGSSVLDIIFLLTKEFCKLVVISVLIAWPISWFIIDKWLQNFAYRTEIGISVFIISGLFALSISIITVSSQTIKTARSNPVKTLKYE